MPGATKPGTGRRCCLAKGLRQNNRYSEAGARITVMAGEGPPSTTHMRRPPSSRILPVPSTLLPNRLRQSHASKTPRAACLGNEVGVKSRSPRAGARSAGLDAGLVTQTQSSVSCGSDQSCSCLECRSTIVQIHVPALASCGVVPHQLISGPLRVAAVPRNPHARGNGPGDREPFFWSRRVSARRGCGPRALDSGGADQARPKLVISLSAFCDVLSSCLAPAVLWFDRHKFFQRFSAAPGACPCESLPLRRRGGGGGHQAFQRFSAAPSGTTPSRT